MDWISHGSVAGKNVRPGCLTQFSEKYVYMHTHEGERERDRERQREGLVQGG